MELNWTSFPAIYTERLELNALIPEDVEDLFKLRSEEESMKYIGRKMAVTLQDAQELMDRTHELFKNEEGINWGIKEKGSSTLMGTIGFYRMKKEHYRAEVGYQLRLPFLRKGFMHEALKAVVEYGFKEMKWHTIEADVNPDNIASRKLLEKNDFTLNGFFKDSFFFDGKFYDSVIYSKLSPYTFEYK